MEKLIERMKKDKKSGYVLLSNHYDAFKSGDRESVVFIQGFLYGLESGGYIDFYETRALMDDIMEQMMQWIKC